MAFSQQDGSGGRGNALDVLFPNGALSKDWKQVGKQFAVDFKEDGSGIYNRADGNKITFASPSDLQDYFTANPPEQELDTSTPKVEEMNTLEKNESFAINDDDRRIIPGVDPLQQFSPGDDPDYIGDPIRVDGYVDGKSVRSQEDRQLENADQFRREALEGQMINVSGDFTNKKPTKAEKLRAAKLRKAEAKNQTALSQRPANIEPKAVQPKAAEPKSTKSILQIANDLMLDGDFTGASEAFNAARAQDQLIQQTMEPDNGPSALRVDRMRAASQRRAGMRDPGLIATGEFDRNKDENPRDVLESERRAINSDKRFANEERNFKSIEKQRASMDKSRAFERTMRQREFKRKIKLDTATITQKIKALGIAEAALKRADTASGKKDAFSRIKMLTDFLNDNIADADKILSDPDIMGNDSDASKSIVDKYKKVREAAMKKLNTIMQQL